jgi:3',5'-cyclic AMP phosphodiesterase CpdA
MKNRFYITSSILIILIFLVSSQFTIADDNTKLLSNDVFIISLPDYYINSQHDQSLTILYPRSTIPAIVEPNQELIIQFQSNLFDKVSATIETAFDSLPDIIILPIESIEQNQQTTIAHAIIPENTPVELYNLTVNIESEGQIYSQTRPRAISVINKIDGNFSFVHIADFHIGDIRGLTENPQEIIGWKAPRKIIEEINLLNPDFVIISGDLTFGQLYPFEYFFEYKKCYEILQEFQVPTYLCPGNHDGYVQTGQDGFLFWEKYFGPLYYSFDYGNYHFLNINSYDWDKIDRLGFSFLVFNWGGSVKIDQLNWIQQDLQDHQDMNTCINIHHNPIWDTTSESLLRKGYHNRDELLDLIYNYQVDAIFAGHVHRDNVTIHNDTLFITTTTVSSGVGENGYWGYRHIFVNNDVITAYNYKEPYYSIPSYRINYSYIDEKTLSIENDLDKEISITIEFVVPFDDYIIENGQIDYIRKNEDMAAYYVSAIIESQTEKIVRLI